MLEKTFRFFIFISLIVLLSCEESKVSISMRDDVGTIKGTLIDPSDNSAINDLEICLQEDSSNCATTNAEGNFEFGLNEYGDYTIVSSDVNYDDMSLLVTNEENSSSEDTYYLPTDAFGTDKYIVVLNWGTTGDLDTHLVISLDGVNCIDDGNHSAFTHNGITSTILDYNFRPTGPSPMSLDANPYAKLDLDDTGADSNNTETVRIQMEGTSTKCGGDYFFYVHNYDFDPAAPKLFSEFMAKVIVMKDGVTVKTYTAEDSGEAKKYWNIFKINSSGDIQDINEFSNDCTEQIPQVDAEGRCESII